MRVFLIAIVVLLGVTCAIAGGYSADGIVDLDTPGVLEALRKDNPMHYETIGKKRAGLSDKTGFEIPLWMRKNFNVTNVSCGRVADASIFLTSNPPKLPLSFTLARTRYRTLITLTKFRQPSSEPIIESLWAK